MKKLLQALLIGAAASALALGLLTTGQLDRWEFTSWSWRVKLFAQPAASTAKVKVILLDQASLDWAASEFGLAWPWPREVYAPIVDFCKRSGAKSVAFDVLYTESSDSDHVEQDELFGQSIARAGNFVGAVFLGRTATQTLKWPEELAEQPASMAGLDLWLNSARTAALVDPTAAFPIAQVATNAALLGNVRDVPDIDAIFRRATTFRVFDGRALPSLGLAAYLVAEPAALAIGNGRLRVGDRIVPTDDTGRSILRFRGPSGTHESFSAASIIQSEQLILEGREPTVSTNALRDAYVFFGFSAPGLKDLRPTPISRDYPGVEIHATFLDNLLAGDFLRDIGRGFVIAGTLLPVLLAAWLVLVCRKSWQVVLVFAVFLALPWIRGFVAYSLGYWWPVIGPELAILLALGSAIILSYATEGRQKRFIKSAFNQYVGEDVLDELVRDPSKLKLGGEKRVLTMFFSDLEKFSSFSERLDPPQLIELLNIYLTEMGAIIKDETGGYLDKFVGDAIVAFWNAPVLQPDHAARALRAALLCQRKVAEKRAEWEEQFKSVLKMRVGIGTGEVVVGNMGSKGKFNYTMLGDAANSASRLEGANKAFGTYTMVSEVTWNAAAGAVLGRELASIRVVGRKTPVRVYEPMALPGEELPAWVADFERGVAFCREQKWKEALSIFEKIQNDHASEVYAEQCRALVSGTLKEWDGVWTLTEK
ncbi:MAG: CHASE2 domain-containing protein [bacterium]